MTADELKRALQAKGMSQAELARKMKVSVVTVSNWVRGVQSISASRQVALSLLLSSPPKDGGQWALDIEEAVYRLIEQEAEKQGVQPHELAECLVHRLAAALATQWCRRMEDRQAPLE